MLQKHLPSIESWLQKMQLKSAKAKQKLNFDSGFYGTSMVGKACLGLAGPGLDVAMDQLPSPWPLGAPAGKDICQRESWHLYFLLNLGLFLSHSFISFLFFFFFAHDLVFIIQNLWAPSMFCSSPCLSQGFLCLFICSHFSFVPCSPRFSSLSIVNIFYPPLYSLCTFQSR